MGTVLAVHHLAVMPPSFFNVLAQRALRLLNFIQPSVEKQMKGFACADLSLMQTDDEALARHINLRHFLRNQGAVDLKLPVSSIESFNSTPEQSLFALAAVKAGAAGKQARRDLALLLNGQAGKVTPERLETLTQKLGELAALPKTRVRMPSGTQHLLSNTVPEILQQIGYSSGSLIEVGLCAYAPKGSDLTFPNAPGVKIDREDALGSGGVITGYIQRELIDGQREASVALSFSQLIARTQRGEGIFAEQGHSRFLPQTELTTRSGAHYLVSNSPDAMEYSLQQGTEKYRIFYDAGPQRAFM